MSSLNNYVLNPKTGRAVSATRSKELQEKGLTPRKLSSIEWIINPETGKPNKKKQVRFANQQKPNSSKEIYLPPGVLYEIGKRANSETRRTLKGVNKEFNRTVIVSPLIGKINQENLDEFITTNDNNNSIVHLYHSANHELEKTQQSYLIVYSIKNNNGSRRVEISNHDRVKTNDGWIHNNTYSIGRGTFKSDEEVNLTKIVKPTYKPLLREILETANKVDITHNNENMKHMKDTWNKKLETATRQK